MRRLSPALLTVVMLGVVGLLVVAYFGKKLLARDEGPPADPLMSIPMALTDLAPGTRLTEAHLGLGRARESTITRDVVRTNRVLVGRVVKNPITAAQPISTFDLYAPGESAPLDMADGMRAVSLTLNVPSSVSVGDYVDVHFTPSVDPESEMTGGRIMTLFKGVKVLAISAGSSGPMRNSSSVTLELTPEQANIILLAEDRGELTLVYTREGQGSGGVAVSDADRATLYEILGYTPKPPEDPEPPFQTEIYSGTGRSVNTFREGVRSNGWDSRDFMPNGNGNIQNQLPQGGRGYGGMPGPSAGETPGGREASAPAPGRNQ